MRTIWKYPVQAGPFTLDLPIGSRILTVQTQVDSPELWVEVPDTEARTEPRHFMAYGTGHPMDEPVREYIGTFQLEGGWLVFHLYEVES